MWKGTFQILAFSVFRIKLFINLKSRDTNRVNVPEPLWSADIFCLVYICR